MSAFLLHVKYSVSYHTRIVLCHTHSAYPQRDGQAEWSWFALLPIVILTASLLIETSHMMPSQVHVCNGHVGTCWRIHGTDTGRRDLCFHCTERCSTIIVCTAVAGRWSNRWCSTVSGTSGCGSTGQTTGRRVGVSGSVELHQWQVINERHIIIIIKLNTNDWATTTDH